MPGSYRVWVEASDGSQPDIQPIVELQVDQLVGRVRERGIEVELTGDARTLLGNLGYDPTYGARPLKRVVQKQLVDKLALKILSGMRAETLRQTFGIRYDLDSRNDLTVPADSGVVLRYAQEGAP